MIGCCLAPSKHFVSNIIARTSYIWWDDDYICFVVDKQTETTIYTPYVRRRDRVAVDVLKARARMFI
jgi:hypothetical protein